MPRQTATLRMVDSAASGWFCHQLSMATMLRSTVCRDVISSFKALNQALYLESLKGSGMLFSSHWLVPRAVTNYRAGSKATGRFPWKAASRGDWTRLGVDGVFLSGAWASCWGVLQFRLQFDVGILNQLEQRGATSAFDPPRAWWGAELASFLSKVSPSWRALCWQRRSRSMPLPLIWARTSLTKTTWLTSPIVAT